MYVAVGAGGRDVEKKMNEAWEGRTTLKVWKKGRAWIDKISNGKREGFAKSRGEERKRKLICHRAALSGLEGAPVAPAVYHASCTLDLKLVPFTLVSLLLVLLVLVPLLLAPRSMQGQERERALQGSLLLVCSFADAGDWCWTW
jgi:hypothetical protein